MSAPVRIGSVIDQLLEDLRPTPVEEIDHLDFDPRCRTTVLTFEVDEGTERLLERSRCERPSAFISTCRACGVRSFVCAEHFNLSMVSPVAGCGVCRTVGPAFDLFDYAPVRG